MINKSLNIFSKIILTHDYHTDGVKQAFNEFCKDKKIPQIQLLGSQCAITKLE